MGKGGIFEKSLEAEAGQLGVRVAAKERQTVFLAEMKRLTDRPGGTSLSEKSAMGRKEVDGKVWVAIEHWQQGRR